MLDAKKLDGKKLCIVIPVFNESSVLEELSSRAANAIAALPLDSKICFVDDGSTDGTLEQIGSICSNDSRFSYISFSRNFGHQVAVCAGIKENDADLYVVMDGDLQDPPELIEKMIDKWQEGYSVVYCVRKKRKENIFKRLAYKLFYFLYRRLAYIPVPLNTGDFCLMDRNVAEYIKQINEHNPFVRGIRSWIGFKQTGINYERDKRFSGKPKYSFRKLVKLAYDGIISFSFAPMKLVINFGFLLSFLSFCAVIYLLVQKFAYGIPLIGWTSTFVLILFVSGIQLLTIGLLGEYIGRIFDEVKRRPLYIIQDRMN